MVADDPAAGKMMPGTGGFRKMRFALPGRGKSGGARVIYIFRNEALPIFLVGLFAKNTKENLSKAERNELAKLADTIFSQY